MTNPEAKIKAPVRAPHSNAILHDALAHVNPANLTRDDWLRIGMALKAEGSTCGTWEEWSQQDAARYRPGECVKLWDGFNGTGVSGGTVVYYAKQAGWTPPHTYRTTDHPPLSWTSAVNDAVPPMPELPEAASDTEQLRQYLCAMFEPRESVCIVTGAKRNDKKQKWGRNRPGRRTPSPTCYRHSYGRGPPSRA